MDSESKQNSPNVVNSDELELVGYRLFSEDRTMQILINMFNPPATVEETTDRFVVLTGNKVLASYEKSSILIVEPIYKGFNDKPANMHTEQALSA